MDDKEIKRQKVSTLKRNISEWYGKVEKVFESKIKKSNSAYYDQIKIELTGRMRELEKNGLQFLFPDEILDQNTTTTTTTTTKVDDELSILFEKLYNFPVKHILNVVEGMAYGAHYTLMNPKPFTDGLIFDNVMMFLKKGGEKEETQSLHKEYNLIFIFWENIAKTLRTVIYFSSPRLEVGEREAYDERKGYCDDGSYPIKINDNKDEDENYAGEIWNAFRGIIPDEITKPDPYKEKIIFYLNRYNQPENTAHLCINILHFAVVFIKYTFPEIDNRIHRQLIRSLICNSFIIQFDVFKLRYSLLMGDYVDRHLKKHALELIKGKFGTQDSILRLFHVTNSITDIISFESNFDKLLRILPSVIKPRECNGDYLITNGRNEVYNIISVIKNSPPTGNLDEKINAAIVYPNNEKEMIKQLEQNAIGQKRGRKEEEYDADTAAPDFFKSGKKTKIDYFEKFKSQPHKSHSKQEFSSVMPYKMYSMVAANIIDGNPNQFIQNLTNMIRRYVNKDFAVRNATKNFEKFRNELNLFLSENGKEEARKKIFSTGNKNNYDDNGDDVIIVINYIYQCLALFQMTQYCQKKKIDARKKNDPNVGCNEKRLNRILVEVLDKKYNKYEEIVTKLVNSCKKLIEDLLTNFVMDIDNDNEDENRNNYILTNFVFSVITQSGWKCNPSSPRLSLSEVGVCVLSAIVGFDVLDDIINFFL